MSNPPPPPGNPPADGPGVPPGGGAPPPPPTGGTPPPPPPPPPPGGGTPPPPPPPPPPPGGGTPPPPPGGGYPPPPPPPPPGGGYPPPPPPGGGYPGGYPPAGQRPFSVGDAIGYGWKKFTQNLGPILIAMIIFMLIGAVLYGLQALLQPDSTVTSTSNGVIVTSSSTGVMGAIISLIFSIIIFLWQYLVEAAIARGGLALTEGRPLVLGELLTAKKLGTIVLAGIILSVLTVIGLILCILPGLVVIFFGSFFIYFVLDQDKGAWDAITSSFSFVKDNAGQLLLLLILCFLITLVGALLCGIGLIVAIPVVAIAKTYAYKVLRGQPVAP